MTTDTNSAESPAGPSHASIFIWLFAIASIWHYMSSGGELLHYWLRFDPVITPLIAIAIITSLIVAVFPNRTPAVLAFAGAQVLVNAVRFPFIADHLVMELALHLGILLSFAWLALKRRSTDIRTEEMFELFSPVGRWLLIVMYFFGTFHKINPGFMSLESSCAIPFTSGFPLPNAVLIHPVSQYTAIYGTLVLEALAMVLLLSSRTKYYGMLLGMSFHFMIGISSFGTLAHFSAFALALHVLFLPSTVGQRLYADPWLPAGLRRETAWQAATIVFVMLQVLFAIHLLETREGYLVNSLFAALAIVMMTMVFKHGQVRSEDAPYRLKASPLGLNLIPIWFFVYCTSPYIGLGTGGVLAMFSGLRMEGGISNHYLIREPLRLFPYQDTIVYFESASNPSLRMAVEQKQGLTMFDFQRHFMHRENLLLPLTVTVNGTTHTLDTPESVGVFGQEFFTEQSWFERKYMSFRLVDAARPDRCRH